MRSVRRDRAERIERIEPVVVRHRISPHAPPNAATALATASAAAHGPVAGMRIVLEVVTRAGNEAPIPRVVLILAVALFATAAVTLSRGSSEPLPAVGAVRRRRLRSRRTAPDARRDRSRGRIGVPGAEPGRLLHLLFRSRPRTW